MLLQRLKLLDSGEKVDELGHPAAEEVETAEDLGGREIKLLGLWHVLEALLGEVILCEISLMQLEALTEHHN